ncbi:MAG TPA: hypothetical protein VJ302_29885, partial [Blastocatellia bacterium]|nr:hypothetical protein [Blastocatellia bacterium]
AERFQVSHLNSATRPSISGTIIGTMPTIVGLLMIRLIALVVSFSDGEEQDRLIAGAFRKGTEPG